MYRLQQLISVSGAAILLLSGCSNHIAAHNAQSASNPYVASTSLYNTFEGCVVRGGLVAESYPAYCSIGDENYKQDISFGKTGDKKRILFQVSPQTSKCQGFHPVWQDCLIVNGGNFFEDIQGYRHKPGIGALLEVERTQICDPGADYMDRNVTHCPADLGVYEYTLVRYLSSNRAEAASVTTFVGRITHIEPGGDGYTVRLTNPTTQHVVQSVLSIPNLGSSNAFDFNNVKLGNTIEVTGELFKIGERDHITARSARFVTN